MEDDDAGWSFEVRETSAGAFLVTGVDRSGRSVTLRGEDPEVLVDEARTWLRSHNPVRE